MVTDTRGQSLESRTVDAVAMLVDKSSDLRPKEIANPADDIDIDAGWPPRVSAETRLRAYAPTTSVRHCTVNDRLRATNDAISHLDVRARLSGRWEVLGCHQECPRDGKIQFRVSFFNYTQNELVEVYVESSKVASVTIRDAYGHPESPIEMAQAIGLARSDAAIAAIVREMDAHAILQVPDDTRSESAGNRCMLVAFTDPDDSHRELLVRYSALVDLRLQKVIVSGPSPCEIAGGSVTQERSSRSPRKGE